MSQASLQFDVIASALPRARLSARRPMIGILLTVIAGISFSEWVHLPTGWWLAIAWAVLLVTAVPWVKRLRSFLLFFLLFSLTAAHTENIRAPGAMDHIANRMQRPVENLQIAGVVSDDPVLEESWRPDVAIWRFPLKVERVLRERDWQTARGQLDVRLETTGGVPDIRYGERWTLQGPVRKNQRRFASAPRLSLFVKEANARRLTGEGGWALRRWCLKGRRLFAERLAVGIQDDPAAVGLARAMTVGYRQGLTEKVQLTFSRTGILHIVAISGAHVGIVALLLLSLVRATGLSQPRWPWVMAPLLILYALSTGMAPSAIRACLMAICFYSAYAFWRQPDALSGFSLSALLILSVAPEQLARPGFLLSYVVVAGLIILFPPTRDWLYRKFIPSEDPTTWLGRSVVAPARRFVLDLIGITWVAWLVSTPLIAGFFNLVSPVALLVNLFVVPLAFLILFSACLALLLGFVHPALLEAYNHATRFFASCLFWIVDTCDKIPGGSFYVLPPPGWLVALLLFLLAVWVVGPRWWRRCAAIGTVGALLLIGWQIGPGRAFEVAARNIGPVSVGVLHIPGSGDWLIDAGPSFSGRRVLNFLNERGVNRLQGVVLTRASTETAGALEEIMASRAVGEIWIPDGRIRSRPFEELMTRMEARGVSVKRRHSGERISLAGGECAVLSPKIGQQYPNSLTAGLVLRFSQLASAFLVFPARTSLLEQNLLAMPQDYGGQAGIEMGFLRERLPPDAAWAAAFRPHAVIRPINTADQFRPEDGQIAEPGLQPIAFMDTAIVRARAGGGFSVIPPAPQRELDR